MKAIVLFLAAVLWAVPLGGGTEGVQRGEELFEANCSICHSLERSLRRRKDREGWLRTVERMAAKMKREGIAELGDEEKALIADYLLGRDR